MPMTIVVTRDVAARFRGFLSSCMLEIAPGVYTAPRMTRGVRERVWQVVTSWYQDLGGGSVLMTWRDADNPGGQAILTLGTPAKELVIHDGLHMVRGEWPADDEGDINGTHLDIEPAAPVQPTSGSENGSLKTE